VWNLLDELDNNGEFRKSDYIFKLAMKNPYEVLGLSPGSNPENIKNKYRELALKYHPDINPNSEELMKEINEAYSLISKNNSRDYLNTLYNFLQSKEFSEFYKSGLLLKYYRYQTGLIRKKSDKIEAQQSIEWLRNSLKDIIKNIHNDKNTPREWSVSEQNIINIMSKGAKNNLSTQEVIDSVMNHAATF